jgi:hypothetical protein
MRLACCITWPVLGSGRRRSPGAKLAAAHAAQGCVPSTRGAPGLRSPTYPGGPQNSAPPPDHHQGGCCRGVRYLRLLSPSSTGQHSAPGLPAGVVPAAARAWGVTNRGCRSVTVLGGGPWPRGDGAARGACGAAIRPRGSPAGSPPGQMTWASSSQPGRCGTGRGLRRRVQPAGGVTAGAPRARGSARRETWRYTPGTRPAGSSSVAGRTASQIPRAMFPIRGTGRGALPGGRAARAEDWNDRSLAGLASGQSPGWRSLAGRGSLLCHLARYALCPPRSI